MDSCQINQIQFQNVRSAYPTGDLVSCFFNVPTQYKPEVGDWIGIYPVGWTSLGHYMCKKMIRPESVFWSTSPTGQQQLGKIEFDMSEVVVPRIGGVNPITGQPQQTYQFVYVKNGEYIHGVSQPFTFGFFGGNNNNTTTMIKEEINVIPTTPFTTSGVLTAGSYLWEPEVEREMSRLQTGIFGIEQSLIGQASRGVFSTPSLIEAEIAATTPYGSQLLGKVAVAELLMNQLVQPSQLRKHWMTRVGDVEQVLIEQYRIEQAHRRIEQVQMLAQLKSYERHIYQVQKHEQAINQYLRQVRIAAKVAEFEQKVYQVLKLQQQQQQYQQQQPEYYVRKYEQLLKEKVELEIVKRVALMQELRETVRQCVEVRLREIQMIEQQQFTRFVQIVKAKLACEAFETQYYQPTIYKHFGGLVPTQSFLYEESIEQQLRQQLNYVIAQIYNEQRQELYELVKAQRQLSYVCGEMCVRLGEFETYHAPEIYGKLRIAKIAKIAALTRGNGYPLAGQWFQQQQQQQHIGELIQLEQLLQQVKYTLRSRLFGNMQQMPSLIQQRLISAEQWGTGVWVKPISQKLRELEWTLRQQEKTLLEQANCGEFSVYGPQQQWIQHRIQSVVQHLRFFEQMQQQQQQHRFEEVRVLMQLRQLESEMCEYPQFFQQYKHLQQQQQWQQLVQAVEFAQVLKSVVREKVALLCQQVHEHQQWSPIECYIQSGHHGVFRQLMQYERKLALLKGIWLEKQIKNQLLHRVVEYEQLSQLNRFSSNGVVVMPRFVEKIRFLKNMLEQHYQLPTVGVYCPTRHYLFSTPEKFFQHHQRVEKLWSLFNEIECQEEVQQQIQQQLVGGPFNGGSILSTQSPVGVLSLVHQQFGSLIQEFQQRLVAQQVQLPELVAQKIHSIRQFLKTIVIEEALINGSQQQPSFLGQQHYTIGQQLREKLFEFETLLSLEQQFAEQVPFGGVYPTGQYSSWLLQTPVSIQQYVRQNVYRQLRQLKNHLEEIVLSGRIGYQPQQQFAGVYEQQQQQTITPFGGCVSTQCVCIGQQQQQPTSIIEQEINAISGTPLGQLFNKSRSLNNIETIVNGGLASLPVYWGNNNSYIQEPFTTGVECERVEKQIETVTSNGVPTGLTQITTCTAATTTGNGLRQSGSPVVSLVENTIGELECELVKLRLQQQNGGLSTYGSSIYNPFNGVYSPQPRFPSSVVEQLVFEEIAREQQQQQQTICPSTINGSLLTTVVPLSTVVKVGQQQQQQTTTTTTVFNVEPQTQGPFGNQQQQSIRIQQRETVQQF